MPQPTLSDVHVSVPLTDLSVQYTQSTDVFVASQVFPMVPVRHQANTYYQYRRNQWFRTDAQLRGPGAESAGTGYTVTTGSYACDVYAIHKDIDDQTRANADAQIALDADATRLVTTHLLQRREQAWVTSFFASSIWGTDVTPTNKWDDYAAGDPIGDLRTGIITMQAATGYRPNTLVLGPQVWNKLQDHPDFLDRVKFTERAIIGTELLAAMLDVNRVLVPSGVKNTSAEAVPDTDSANTFIYGKNALLLYVEPNLTLNSVSAGATFVWSAFPGAGENGIRIKRFRLERNAVDRIEGEESIDQKVIATDLGYFFNAAVA